MTEGEKVLKPLRAFGSPMVDLIQPMPFPQMQTLLDAAFPEGNHNYWKSTFLHELSDDAIDVLVEYANRATSPLSGIAIEYYGGVAGRVRDSKTAFAQRQAQYSIGILAQWTSPGESQHHIEWARGLANSMRPFSSGAYMLHFLGEEGEDTIKAVCWSQLRPARRYQKEVRPYKLLPLEPEYQAVGPRDSRLAKRHISAHR
jgi:hypothetical protein